ncbi:DUF536 domain-containing protein [Leuconostoc mesenteroides]|uniref:DUF536 domain-containing protein n=1 Tax=Leuconostoc mesenteroides TaxID=1245 RepID=UPI002074947F|nr:DUF536 domain-containing protein [Leuconostoc mesenteroides]MCM6834376.1 DUF536 domain-containing protein [Leuconostoc mesenteroides]
MENKKYTILKIADIAGVNKQKVSRFIKKNNIKSISKSGQSLLYDEAVKNLIIKELGEKTVSNNETLIKQLQEKDKQIERLSNLLENQQLLTLNAQKDKETLQIELSKINDKKSWWKRIFS